MLFLDKMSMRLVKRVARVVQNETACEVLVGNTEDEAAICKT